jgi:hypothetical protein
MFAASVNDCSLLDKFFRQWTVTNCWRPIADCFGCGRKPPAIGSMLNRRHMRIPCGNNKPSGASVLVDDHHHTQSTVIFMASRQHLAIGAAKFAGSPRWKNLAFVATRLQTGGAGLR